MSKRNSEAMKTMQQITETGFAIDEALLYLDTHPCDEAALEQYQMLRCSYKKLADYYTQNFGPLTKTDVVSDNYFTWVSDPWPWEGGDC